MWVSVSSRYVLQCEELTSVLCTSFEKEKIQVLTHKLLRPLEWRERVRSPRAASSSMQPEMKTFFGTSEFSFPLFCKREVIKLRLQV